MLKYFKNIFSNDWPEWKTLFLIRAYMRRIIRIDEAFGTFE